MESKRRMVIERLKRCVNNLVNQSINFEFIGAADPDDHEQIERDYRNAKRNYRDALNELTKFLDQYDNAACARGQDAQESDNRKGSSKA